MVSVSVPAPTFVRPPEPPIAPDSVLALDLVSNVPLTLAFIEKNFMDDYSAEKGEGGHNELDSSTQYAEAWMNRNTKS